MHFTSRYSIELIDGSSLRLTSIKQSESYAGWLEGFPRPQDNYDIQIMLLRRAFHEFSGFQGLAKDAKDRLEQSFKDQSPIPEDIPLSLIAPKLQTDPERPDRQLLPPVACVGTFEGPATDPNQDLSIGVVAWFQMDFTPIIHPDIIKQIQQINWPTSSMDFCY